MNAMEVQNKDLVYDDNIKTVLLHPPSDQLLPPVLRLNSTDKLRLSFDDMSPESYQFKYTFVHCTENWETSDLDQMDYLNGFFEDDIRWNYFTQYGYNKLSSKSGKPPILRHYSGCLQKDVPLV